MGLFSNKKEGGLMDIIRCDEPEYLVWKWRPSGSANSTSRENSIRYGSSLRVKDGELAVFVYKQESGTIQDFIVGPHDDTIKTANFPVLSSIIGTAFGSSSPFQAEIYFINLQGNIPVNFGFNFEVFDPRFLDFGVPTFVRGSITFNLTNYKEFIKLHRLIDFDLDDFNLQIKDAVTRNIKSVVTNIPSEKQIPVLQLERMISEINDLIKPKVKEVLESDYGVNLKRFDLSAIEFDKESTSYAELRRVTANLQTTRLEAELGIGLMDKTMQVEGKNMGVYQLDKQTEVLKAAAESLGHMGDMNLGGGGGGMNPAGMMTGMAIGSVMGNQMGGMMNNIIKPTAPPPPTTLYHIALNGQQSGPFSLEQLMQLSQNGQFTKNHHVWKDGMAAWELAGTVQDIATVFPSVPPPPPPPTV